MENSQLLLQHHVFLLATMLTNMIPMNRTSEAVTKSQLNAFSYRVTVIMVSLQSNRTLRYLPTHVGSSPSPKNTQELTGKLLEARKVPSENDKRQGNRKEQYWLKSCQVLGTREFLCLNDEKQPHRTWRLSSGLGETQALKQAVALNFCRLLPFILALGKVVVAYMTVQEKLKMRS